jgi:dihydroxyacetone kinase
MGGASGALFASLFLEIGKSSVGANTLESRHLAEGSRAALATIRRLGKTRTGDKTMLDALTPAASTLEANASGNLALALARAAEAARGGAEATKGMAARRGRAQYVPQAGLGHLDPGAVSVLLIFETWRDAARSEERKL